MKEFIFSLFEEEEDGGFIIRDDDNKFVDGCSDFIDEIAAWFKLKGTKNLIVNYPKYKVKTDHMLTYISAENGIDTDLPFDGRAIEEQKLYDICDKYINKEIIEVERLKTKLDDARAASRNSATLEEFKKFQKYIEDLQEEIDEFEWEAKKFKNFIWQIIIDSEKEEYDDEHIIGKYVLITLKDD